MLIAPGNYLVALGVFRWTDVSELYTQDNGAGSGGTPTFLTLELTELSLISRRRLSTQASDKAWGLVREVVLAPALCAARQLFLETFFGLNHIRSDYCSSTVVIFLSQSARMIFLSA